MSSEENETVSGPEKDGKSETRESKSCKKRKRNMSEVVSVDRTNLLQVLRENPRVEFKFDGTTDAAKEARFIMNLILQHASQFPSKLRVAIANAKVVAEDGYCRECCECSDEIPIIFVGLVRKCVEDFIFGRDIPEGMDHYDVEFDENGEYFEFDLFDDVDYIQDIEKLGLYDRATPEPWYGPDSDIDTEEEIELAIRLFPSVLKSKRPLVLDAEDRGMKELEWFNNMLFLAKSAQAVSFIPLFADLAVELGMDVDTDFFFLASRLLHNELHNDHDKGFATLVRLKEKGFLKQGPNSKEDYKVWHLTNICFELAVYSWDARFFDIRLRFMVNWLMEGKTKVEGSRHVTNLLEYFQEYDTVDIRLYEILFEGWISHFPHDLLEFAFHGDTFALVCDYFEEETVNQVMNEKIAVALARSEKKQSKSNTLQSWVMKAATSHAVSLDGLYTLIRFDPGKGLSGTTTSLA